MTAEEILRAIDEVIDGDKPLYGWEQLVSRRHCDAFTEEWAIKFRDLETDFHVPGSGQLISDEGVDKLKLLRAELLAACP
jgi:hypothetical protein